MNPLTRTAPQELELKTNLLGCSTTLAANPFTLTTLCKTLATPLISLTTNYLILATLFKTLTTPLQTLATNAHTLTTSPTTPTPKLIPVHQKEKIIHRDNLWIISTLCDY